MSLEYDGKAVTGNYKGSDKQYQIQQARITGNALSFEFPVDYQGREITIAFTGRIEDDDIEGTVSFVGKDGSLDFPWRARRD